MKRRLISLSLPLVLAGLLHASPSLGADVTIDRTKKLQTIEGFGFFGGADVWWSTPEAVLDPAWCTMVIDDLGLTMWRNEYYPTITPQAPQDADWAKQKPVVQALHDAAEKSKVPLKTVLTVWSPPADYKCIVADNGVPDWGTCKVPLERPTDTKVGNILDPAMTGQMADWLNAGLQMYADIGVDVYALSFQNEPYFWEPYNSCFYSQDYYQKTLAAIGPTIKAAHPNVLLFGSENMLGIECGAGPDGDQFDPWFYTSAILDNAGALSQLDRFAVHGYNDGVTATATSKLAKLWVSMRTGTAAANKPLWMTETSGYAHSWAGGQTPGAFDLGQAIYAALYYGQASAWVYWQGSEADGASEYSLMGGAANPGKNYYVSKQYYRYVRPGAQMVDLASADPELLAVAFDHEAMGAFTIVALNTGSSAKDLVLQGANLPSTFKAIRTSETENAVDLGDVTAGSIQLPPSSITTLVSGNVYEALGGSGGGGAGGTTGTGGSTGGSGGGGAGGGAGGGSGDGGTSNGCGCTTVGTSAARGEWLLLLGLLIAARRRRRTGS